MKIKIKIFPWDPPLVCDSGNWGLEKGDHVVLNLEAGTEAGRVVEIDVKDDSPEIPKIVRKATSVDVETLERNKEKGFEAINACKKLVKEKGLPMKIVDAHYSFDGGKITFSFIAEKRVDFRDLVKMLSKSFQRSIRLQQIGSRDEARGKGGFGACGRELCCIKFSGSLKSVTTDDARVQQMGQRGSERLSGLCGRLKCCLGFESELYREILAKMPELGSPVSADGKRGVVRERHILESEVTVVFEDKSEKRIPISKIKQITK